MPFRRILALAIVVAQFEKQVGLFFDRRAVEVMPLSLPHHELKRAFIEAFHLARLTQIVLNRAAKCGGYVVFGGGSEVKLLFAQQLEGAEQNAANEQDDGQTEARMRKMPIRPNAEREETRCDR